MTQSNHAGKLEAVKRADVNRARKIQAIRELSRLLDEATHPAFTGRVAVEVPALSGNLGQVQTTRIARPDD